MEDDTDRLAYIQGGGGVTVSTARGEALAIFDSMHMLAALDPPMEGYAPVLSAIRTMDAERLGLTVKGAAVSVQSKIFHVVRHQPDGQGISIVVLKL